MTEIRMDDRVRQVALEQVINRRDKLLARQAELREHRRVLAIEERALDRELADCRAAARFFGLEVEFPPDEREEAERNMLMRRRETVVVRLAEAQRHGNQEELGRVKAELDEIEARLAIRDVRRQPQAQLELSVPNPEQKQKEIVRQPLKKMPRVRDVVLDQLRSAGKDGYRATPIQKYIEDTYGVEIHEKTVGMTLYRLSREGLVHRNGHTWFFGPESAKTPPETENPGAGTPGTTQ